MKNYSHPLLVYKLISKKYNIKKEYAYEFIKKQNEYKNIPNHISVQEGFIFYNLHNNIFIKDNCVFDLLISSEIKISSTFEELNKLFPFKKFDRKDESGNEGIEFCIVINSKIEQISTIIYVAQSKDSSVIHIFITNKYDSWDITLSKNQDIKDIKNIINNTNSKKYINLLFNLIFYANSFPDKIINGLPDDFKDVGLNNVDKKLSFCINPHESLIDRSGVTPHFRRGHFAKLESDRYVNKKGQIIWISAAMVKGFEAKTVIE